MVPGNAEEAAGIEVDEEPGEEEEPADMLNGTAPCVWGRRGHPVPPLTYTFSPPLLPSSCLHMSPFSHPRSLLCSPSLSYCMLRKFLSVQNI